MARILIVGAGVVGLGTAMLLAGDGHEVTVVERDPAPPPDAACDAWNRWQRRGVNQFHQPHAFLTRFRDIVEADLPVVSSLEREGALRLSLMNDVIPESVSGGWREGDEHYELVTGRRPFVESILASAAASTPGIDIRRGEAVVGLLTGPCDLARVPHVVGVRTDRCKRVPADLVVDIGGRRSVLPSWMATIGARPPAEELEDSGFMYFGRHFRSRDGSLPALVGVFRWDWDTISTLCLPADNGTWCLGLVIHSRDKALYGLRRLDRWEAVLGKMGLVAHWLDGEPIDEGVAVLTRLEDRHRDLVVDGCPVVTGVVAVGDAWGATNPSLGRGASIGMMHALALRHTIREAGLDDPGPFAERFGQMTREVVEPWYRATLAQDRHRAARVEAGMRGGVLEPEETQGALVESMFQLAPFDQDLLRPSLDIRLLLRHPDEVFESDPGLEARIRDLAADRPTSRMTGLAPERQELVALANA